MKSSATSERSEQVSPQQHVNRNSEPLADATNMLIKLRGQHSITTFKKQWSEDYEVQLDALAKLDQAN